LDRDLVDLESAVKSLPGVLGCTIFSAPDGSVSEIQAFIRRGADKGEVQDAIFDEVKRRDLQTSLRRVFVFELEAEQAPQDHDSLQEAVEVAQREAESASAPGRPAPSTETPTVTSALGPRPVLQRVTMDSSERSTEAQVALTGARHEVVGRALDDPSASGLELLARATLEAVHQLVGEWIFTLEAASLVSEGGRDAVVVFVRSAEGLETVGAALVRGGERAEAAVRATLDAINRRIAQGS
jgi:hypothetical protein